MSCANPIPHQPLLNMKDQVCPTCSNPLGVSLKALREERDRLIPFVTQHRSKRDEFLKLEKELKERIARQASAESEIAARELRLEQNESALDDLLRDARRPEEEFKELERQIGKLNQKNLELSVKMASMAAEHQVALDKLNHALESQRLKTADERKKRKAAEQHATQLGTDLENLTEAHQKLVRDHGLLESRYARQTGLLETARGEVASLKRTNRDLATQASAATAEASSLRRTNEQLVSSNREMSGRIRDLQAPASLKLAKNGSLSFPCGSPDLDLIQALSGEVDANFAPPAEVVTMGSGPFPESDFDRYLATLGISAVAQGCSWIIVGRQDWSVERLNQLIDDADIDEVRVFSQELFIAGILTTHDPFSLPLEVLMKFAEGHPALEHLIEAGFEWPEIVVEEEDFGEPIFLRGSSERAEESPLYRMGYQVGITNGLSPTRRRALLKSAYQGPIPDVEDD